MGDDDLLGRVTEAAGQFRDASAEFRDAGKWIREHASEYIAAVQESATALRRALGWPDDAVPNEAVKRGLAPFDVSVTVTDPTDGEICTVTVEFVQDHLNGQTTGFRPRPVLIARYLVDATTRWAGAVYALEDLGRDAAVNQRGGSHLFDPIGSPGAPYRRQVEPTNLEAAVQFWANREEIAQKFVVALQRKSAELRRTAEIPPHAISAPGVASPGD